MARHMGYVTPVAAKNSRKLWTIEVQSVRFE